MRWGVHAPAFLLTTYMVTAIVSIDWRYLHTNYDNRLLRKCEVFCTKAWRGLELAVISAPMCKRAFSQLYWGSIRIILRLNIHGGISTASNFHYSLCHHVPIQLAASYSFKIPVSTKLNEIYHNDKIYMKSHIRIFRIHTKCATFSLNAFPGVNEKFQQQKFISTGMSPCNL